ncbi:hypothetical protein CHARACLAT_015320 [Characodon lateralis]|uniref:Uncharacterized protein n=1 Tax=Characodon lateralis TaxID=208331 RepID=A0ABU7DT69_9TELE|nr:hypothetical protein [Characodon lateralis]
MKDKFIYFYSIHTRGNPNCFTGRRRRATERQWNPWRAPRPKLLLSERAKEIGINNIIMIAETFAKKICKVFVRPFSSVVKQKHNGSMNSPLNQKMLKENVQLSVHDLELNRTFAAG